MRKLIGVLVLLAGTGGLGYVGMTVQARGIESQLQAAAEAAVAEFSHGVQTQVSGRDLSAFGLAYDTGEVARIEAVLTELRGVRALDVAGVETLPVADPYQMLFERPEGGVVSVSGVVPSEAALPEGIKADVTLASGAPDERWSAAVGQVIQALRALQSGEARLVGRDVAITGIAVTPQDAEAMRAVLAGLPEGYGATDEIEVLDDGLPFVLSARVLDGALDASGKFPTGLDVAAIAQQFNIADTGGLSQAVIPARTDDWDSAVAATLSAVSQLIEGEARLEENRLTLTGTGSPEGIEEAERLVAELPAPFEVTTDLSVYGADFELRLSMEWDGQTAVASGTYPADFRPRGPAGVAVADSGETLFLPDDAGAFTANANAGVAALSLLNTGTLIATARRITLTGIATSPRVGVTLDAVLEQASAEAEIERVINYLDDGSPAAWSLRFDAGSGVQVEGRLPNGLTVDALAEALGVASVSGAPVTAQEDDRQGGAVETLAIIAPYLPEAESMGFIFEDGTSSLDLILAPGVDLDLVAIDLVERLPADVAFSLGPLETLPAAGTERVNAATGQSQVFQDGFWLPDVDFTTDLEGCAAETASVLARDRIAFLSASARLDAASIRAINGLAAIVRPCVETGLTFEVGGHTDASGDATENEVLSQERAEAVRAALVARGVPARSVTAFGFGASQPIADNETAEGREVNRRTDITWFEQGAVRDP